MAVVLDRDAGTAAAPGTSPYRAPSTSQGQQTYHHWRHLQGSHHYSRR